MIKSFYTFLKNYLFNVVLATVLAVAFLVSGLALAQGIPWNSPSANPPQGNPAGFILANPSNPPQNASFNVSGSGSVGGLSVSSGDVNLFGSSSLYLASGELCFGGTEQCIDFDNFDNLGGLFTQFINTAPGKEESVIFSDIDKEGDISDVTSAHVIMTDGSVPPRGQSSKIQVFNRDDWIELRNDLTTGSAGPTISALRWGDDGNDIFKIQHWNKDWSQVNTALTVTPWQVDNESGTLLPGGGYVGIGTESPDSKLHVHDITGYGRDILSLSFNLPSGTPGGSGPECPDCGQTGYGSTGFLLSPFVEEALAQTIGGDGNQVIDFIRSASIGFGFEDRGGYMKVVTQPTEGPVSLSLVADSAQFIIAPDHENQAYVRWQSGHESVSAISLKNNNTEFLGALYGASNSFGLLSNASNWILRSTSGATDIFADNSRKLIVESGGLTLTNSVFDPNGDEIINSNAQRLQSIVGDLVLQSSLLSNPSDVRVQLDQTNEKFKVQRGATGSEVDIFSVNNNSSGANLFINAPFRYWPQGIDDVTANQILVSDDQGFASWADPGSIFSGTFLGLSDTPASYNQPAGWLVGINSAGNGLTFIDPDSVGGGGSGGGGGNSIVMVQNPELMTGSITGNFGTVVWKDISPASSVPNDATAAFVHFTERPPCQDNYQIWLGKRNADNTVFNYGRVWSFVGGTSEEHTGGLALLPLTSGKKITIGSGHGSCNVIEYVTVAWVTEGEGGSSGGNSQIQAGRYCAASGVVLSGTRIDFPQPFSQIPIVVITPSNVPTIPGWSGAAEYDGLTEITTTGFTVSFGGNTANRCVDWVAMPEGSVAAGGGESTLSSSYVGRCDAQPGSSCKCNSGEKIMLIDGNSAGSSGYCVTQNQGTTNVRGVCDANSSAASYFSCFK